MLIIFDCDGVLRNIYWEGIFNAYKAIFLYKRVDYNEFFTNLDEFKQWFDPDFKKKLKETLDLTETDFAMANEIFREHYEGGVHVFPWVENLLKKLDKRHKLTILTSSHSLAIRESLGSKLCDWFKIIIGQEHHTNLKPDPEGIHFIIEKLKVDYADALIIGDAGGDVEAGKRAGIKTGIVSWGIGKWDELLTLNPDYKFKNPEDLFLL